MTRQRHAGMGQASFLIGFLIAVVVVLLLTFATSSRACTTQHGLGYRPEPVMRGHLLPLPVNLRDVHRLPLSMRRSLGIKPLPVRYLRAGDGIAYGGIKFYAGRAPR